jgi:hypothetical protein
MGYDMRLVKTYNHCDFCKRHDEDWLESNWYMSYNHGWAFYKWLDDEKGIRWIYGKSMEEVCKRLNTVIDKLIIANNNVVPEHELDPNTGEILWKENKGTVLTIDGEQKRDDGWAKTMFNAFRCATELLQISSNYIGVKNVHWIGD